MTGSQRQALRRAAWWVALAALLAAPAAAQDAQGPKFADLKLGIGGYYKLGVWTPVEVTLQAGTQPVIGWLRLVVPDGDGVPTVYTPEDDRPLALQPGERRSAVLYARVGRGNAEIEVALRDRDGRVLAERRFDAAEERGVELEESQRLVIVAGGNLQLGLDDSDDPDSNRLPEVVVARLSSPAQLPTRWYGWEGVDTALLLGSEREFWLALRPADPQLAALAEWVRQGGKALLSVGFNAEQLLRPGLPLAELLPGQLAQRVPLRQAPEALARLAESNEPLLSPEAAQDRKFVVNVAQLAQVRGRVVAAESDGKLPLVVRGALGFGEVTFLAVDLDRQPLDRWKSRPALLRKLLNLPVRGEPSDPTPGGPVGRLGYEDVAGQLRSQLDEFPGVSLVPFWIVALLIVGYIALIGPGDYFLVKHVLRRVELTWVTFPIMVIGTGAAAYCAAHWLKGDQLRVNHAELVDFDLQSGQARGTFWTNVFSPRHDSYNLALDVRAPGQKPGPPRRLVSWLGLPGEGLGGMRSRAGGGSLFSARYAQRGDLAGVDGMPIAVWSTKGIAGRWSAAADAPLAARLVDEGDSRLSGTLANRCGATLADCVLYYGAWAYPLGALADGQSIELRHGENAQSLDSLVRQRLAEPLQAHRQGAGPGSPLPILHAMSIYDLARLEASTELAHRYQSFADLSGALRGGRAVLIGAAPRVAARVLRDGRPLADESQPHWSLYRFVIPVQQGTAP